MTRDSHNAIYFVGGICDRLSDLHAGRVARQKPLHAEEEGDDDDRNTEMANAGADIVKQRVVSRLRPVVADAKPYDSGHRCEREQAEIRPVSDCACNGVANRRPGNDEMERQKHQSRGDEHGHGYSLTFGGGAKPDVYSIDRSRSACRNAKDMAFRYRMRSRPNGRGRHVTPAAAPITQASCWIAIFSG